MYFLSCSNLDRERDYHKVYDCSIHAQGFLGNIYTEKRFNDLHD